MKTAETRWPPDQSTTERWPTPQIAMVREDQLREAGYRTFLHRGWDAMVLCITEVRLGHPRTRRAARLEELPQPPRPIAKWQGRTYREWVRSWHDQTGPERSHPDG